MVIFVPAGASTGERVSHQGIGLDPMTERVAASWKNDLMQPPHPSAGPGAGPSTPDRAETLVVEHDGPVTVVTIDRPERRNAVDSLCADQLREAFLAFEQDDARSVAVLTGSGGTFCAGADL
jgi:hypothetical protein